MNLKNRSWLEDNTILLPVIIITHSTLPLYLTIMYHHYYIYESESYGTTDGQSAILSWNEAPIWGLRPDLYYCQTVAGLLMWGALSDESMGQPYTTAAGPLQRSRSWIRVPRDSWWYFTVSDSRLPQPGGPGPLIYIPRNRVAQLYLQALCSRLVASYDSQCYRGGTRTGLHAGYR
jgi:hypothetical protein